MIFPADDPREALMSRGEERLRLQKPARIRDRSGPGALPCGLLQRQIGSGPGRNGISRPDPGSLGGKVIASHIRLVEDGPVRTTFTITRSIFR